MLKLFQQLNGIQKKNYCPVVVKTDDTLKPEAAAPLTQHPMFCYRSNNEY